MEAIPDEPRRGEGAAPRVLRARFLGAAASAPRRKTMRPGSRARACFSYPGRQNGSTCELRPPERVPNNEIRHRGSGAQLPDSGCVLTAVMLTVHDRLQQ